ncbi:Metallo-dependent phosphatase-like protein [Mycena albidolilacea]|uniref:Metallo-dependent phosphatase-like protein n=1 Tax=Mycena albidolilacea TaxID=1033008 RepID=A0AAD6ZVA4_9AGAR|nr:Metallo-dependent phosphatase-like protein [Mycena albidolilacea]
MMILGATLLLASSASAFPLGRSISNTLGGIITGKTKLTFNAAGSFKVVSFSDMHMGERPGDGSWAPWGPANDAATQVVHETVLDNEKPSYVVFNGDMMTGENVFKANATNYLDMVYQPTVARNIPFSSTHGNHDNANNINHQEEIEYEQAHYAHLSYTRSDVGPKPYGCGNYWVPVYAKTTDWVPAAILWFFDSRSFVSGTGNGPGPIPDAANYYWVDPDTVPNYIKLQRLLMNALWWKVPPALVFVHIPVQKAQILAPLPSPGDHDDEPDPSTQGFFNNTYTGLDLPFWDQIVALDGGKGKVLAITSGHDHGESWCARSKESSGIPICFNGHSGYGGYVTEHSAVRNGRVFDLNLKDLSKKVPTLKTWNSYEDDTTDDAVELGPDYMAQYN